jgi:hypothetical protein
MDVYDVLIFQQYTAAQLGTSVAQFQLSRQDVMDLGSEILLRGGFISMNLSNMASLMAMTGALEKGTTFMGISLIASDM